MIRSTPTPSNPFWRNSLAATSRMRWRFSVHCSRVTLMATAPVEEIDLDNLDDDRHICKGHGGSDENRGGEEVRMKDEVEPRVGRNGSRRPHQAVAPWWRRALRAVPVPHREDDGATEPVAAGDPDAPPAPSQPRQRQPHLGLLGARLAILS